PRRPLADDHLLGRGTGALDRPDDSSERGASVGSRNDCAERDHAAKSRRPLENGPARATMTPVTVRSGQAWMLALIAVGLVAVGASWAKVAKEFSGARPAVAPGRASAIVWANRVFDSQSQLRRWLRSRGTTY